MSMARARSAAGRSCKRLLKDSHALRKEIASKKSSSSARRRDWSDADTEENLDRLFLENNWTDKLPIILPTEKKVAEMLAHTSRKPDEVVGHLRSNQFRLHWEFTVEKG